MTRDRLASNLKADLQNRSYRLTGDPKIILEQTISGHLNGRTLFLNFINNVSRKLMKYEARLDGIYVLEEDKKRRRKVSYKNGEEIFDGLIRSDGKVFIVEVMIRNKRFQIPVKL
jgi:hypothetical protein